ncbi:MAG TPA: hypothetical protein PLW93_01980 [Candidatus Absconditabacterales bacterium]|nr:hypothetical protein [Candidatus Absconditabacterales bacterium]
MLLSILMIQRYINIIIILTIMMTVWLGFGGRVQSIGYFQPQFYCSFSGSVLTITTNTHPYSRNCLDMISTMRSRKQDIIKQIDMLSGSTTSYNLSVRKTLVKNRNDLDLFIQNTIEGINTMEAKLFSNTKKTYITKLKQIRAKIIEKQAVLVVDLTTSINDGQRTMVQNIISAIGFNYQRLKLIEGVLSSKSADEMMPLLHIYQGIINQQLSGNLSS